MEIMMLWYSQMVHSAHYTDSPYLSRFPFLFCITQYCEKTSVSQPFFHSEVSITLQCILRSTGIWPPTISSFSFQTLYLNIYKYFKSTIISLIAPNLLHQLGEEANRQQWILLLGWHSFLKVPEFERGILRGGDKSGLLGVKTKCPHSIKV